MPTIYIHLIIIFMLLLLLVFAIRAWWRKPKRAQEVQTLFAIEEKGRIAVLWDRLRGISRLPLAQRFQKWSEKEIDEEDLKAWVLSLSSKPLKALVVQLGTYTASKNVNLEWVINGKYDTDPELKRLTDEIVVFYCASAWRSAEVQADLQLLTVYNSFTANPFHSKYEQFRRQLYSRLIETGLVASPTLSEVVEADEDTQQDKAVKAIRAAADTDRRAFNHVLRATLAEMGWQYAN